MPMEFGFGRIFPKICEIFRGGEPKNVKKAGFRGKKSGGNPEKRIFISLTNSQLQRKCRKSEKKCAGVLE